MPNAQDKIYSPLRNFLLLHRAGLGALFIFMSDNSTFDGQATWDQNSAKGDGGKEHSGGVDVNTKYHPLLNEYRTYSFIYLKLARRNGNECVLNSKQQR